MDLSETVSADVIVCSDDADAKAMAMELSEKIEGVRGVDGGALENSRYVGVDHRAPTQHKPALQRRTFHGQDIRRLGVGHACS